MERSQGAAPAAAPAPVVGIVAGGGQFPLLCARAVREAGGRVVAACHRGETDPRLESEAHVSRWFHLGQLGRLLGFFRKEGVEEVIFAGTIAKRRIFFDVRPDLRALALWRRLGSRLDDNLLKAVASELEGEGFQVVSATRYLHDLVTPRGVLSRRAPSREEWEDIRFGWRIAKEIGRLDIGQCVVVKERTVLAVEAMEGTDATIRRGGELARGGAVVVKVCKPHQDLRFDLPSLGVATIETMAQAGAAVLAVEAGRSLFFDRGEALELARRRGVAVVGLTPEEVEG